MDISQKLIDMRDEKYRDFTARLIPNISKETIIGVRLPNIRSLSKKLIKSGEYVDFINSYTSADPMEALNMLESYSSYMEQYAEALTKLGEINQGDLSTADLLYYTEVTKRIYDRLGEIGQ